MKRLWKWIAGLAAILVLALFSAGTWFASNQLLFPSFNGITKDLSVCTAEAAKSWGEGCGNLRMTQQFAFSEVQIPSVNGYDLPGWLIPTSKNGDGIARGAILMIPAGGSDRREETRYVKFLLGQGLDVLTIDLGCQGEAPCPVPGVSYGQRESRDVLSAYLYLSHKYGRVFVMGSSVGAASILIALPEMPGVAGVIAENPIPSFAGLITETPMSASIPGWFTQLLIRVTMLRGQFDGLLSPANSLRLVSATPIFFIHSTKDSIVPVRLTQDLAGSYAGPKTAWFPDKGAHAAIWDADPAEYEKRLADFLSGIP